jgi:L-alanine-DL-glutamate epimerase-like enolase superfamily enzyme
VELEFALSILSNFGLKESIDIKNGHAQLPSKPGLGIDLDWDFIENTTFKKV